MFAALGTKFSRVHAERKKTNRVTARQLRFGRAPTRARDLRSYDNNWSLRLFANGRKTTGRSNESDAATMQATLCALPPITTSGVKTTPTSKRTNFPFSDGGRLLRRGRRKRSFKLSPSLAPYRHRTGALNSSSLDNRVISRETLGGPVEQHRS